MRFCIHDECASSMIQISVPGVFMASSSRKTTQKKAPSNKRKWVSRVKTESTYPPKGLFTRSPETIARQLASKKVSPKGPGSGMRMLTYFMNRAGKALSAARRARLEKAKELLAKRIRDAREKERKNAA
jgi:Protein of unknown function (DUF3175)